MAVDVLHREGKLLVARLRALHTCFKLGERGITLRLGGEILQLHLVDLRLGGRADLEKRLGVVPVLFVQSDLSVQNVLLVAVARRGARVADLRRAVLRERAFHVERADHVARLDRVARLDINGGAFGRGRDVDARFAAGGHLTGDRVLRGDVLRLDRLHLHGDAGGRGDGLFLFAARKAQHQRERQQQGNRFLFHRFSPPQPASRP